MSGLYSARMREAIALAPEALASGDVPVAALVLDADGEVLARAVNEREKSDDPTAHAEVLAIRAAAAARGDWHLTVGAGGRREPPRLVHPLPVHPVHVAHLHPASSRRNGASVPAVCARSAGRRQPEWTQKGSEPGRIRHVSGVGRLSLCAYTWPTIR